MANGGPSSLGQQNKWREELVYCTQAANLHEVYENKGTAEAVAHYLREFVPYSTKYPASICFIKMGSRCAVCMSFLLRVVPKGHSRALEVDAGFIMPSKFPMSPPKCRVRVRTSSRSSSDGVHSSGTDVRLGDILPLTNARFSCPLIDVLLALRRKLEENLQFFITKYPLQQEEEGFDTKGDPAASIMRNNATSSCCRKQLSETAETTNKPQQRLMGKQQAAQSLIAWQERKVASYFTLREEGMSLMQSLRASREETLRRRIELHGAKENLLRLATSLERLEEATILLRGGADSLEEHSRCIVPEDDLQARALELLGEIHASDDALDLLERLLKAGRLSCEEYVRRVSDIGRKQFEARFLFGRVTEAVNRAAPDAGLGVGQLRKK